MHAIVAVLALVVVLFGCSMVRSDVTRFDQLPQSIAGQSVYFLPRPEQTTSAAYQVHAGQVAGELAKHGILRTNDITTADYAVVMAYGAGDGRQVSGALPLYGQTGGGTTFHSGSVSTFGYGGSSYGTYSGQSYTSPTYGIVGMIPYSETEYDRFLSVRMIDLERSTEENIVPVYEGNVVSTGNAASFDQVAGCMIQALFQDFRQSGSDHVTMATSECQQVPPTSVEVSVRPPALPPPIAPTAVQRPVEAPPVVQPAPPAEIAPAAGQPVDDPCAKYKKTPTEARCRLYVSPNGWQDIPPAGRNADLDSQLRCAPFRSNPRSYEQCISR